MSALTALFAATVGSPMIKVAAFSYGVRQALGGLTRERPQGPLMRRLVWVGVGVVVTVVVIRKGRAIIGRVRARPAPPTR